MKTNKFYLHYLLFITSVVLFSSFNHAHSLENAINSKDRSSKNISRDKYRNPYETLSFFEIKQDMKVVELSPGGGWYTEILANYIHSPGVVIAAHFDKNSPNNYLRKSRLNFEKKINNFLNYL